MRFIPSRPNSKGFMILLIKHSNIKISSKIRVKASDFLYKEQTIIRNNDLSTELDYIRFYLEVLTFYNII